jgi:hypothetical protein
MALINRLERKLGWIAIPGLVRIIMCFQVLVFVLMVIQSSQSDGQLALYRLLSLDIDMVMKGEVWRLVSFAFLPPTLGMIGMFFAVVVTVLLAELLESLWGSFRMTLYIIGGGLGTIAGAFVVWSSHGGAFLPTGVGNFVNFSTYLFSGNLLFAAAVYNPNLEFRLFFVIPVKLAWIAIFGGAGLLLLIVSALGSAPAVSLALLLSVSNFIVVFFPGFKRALKMRGETAVRRRKFDAVKASSKFAMHECANCGKTENDDAELVFRVTAEGEEFCADCRAKQLE